MISKISFFNLIFIIYRVATLPGNLEKYGKTWNWQFRKRNLEFEQKSQNNLEKPGIFNNFYMLSSKISI